MSDARKKQIISFTEVLAFSIVRPGMRSETMNLLKKFEKTALVWKDEHVSYPCLLRKTAYYASMVDGNKVAIISENRPEWIYALYGTWSKKSVAVPIDFMATPDEVAYILNDCHPHVVFCSLQTKDTVNRALSDVHGNIAVRVFEDIAASTQAFPDNDIIVDNAEDTAAIIYTSGTTGSPKGVMLSYDNIFANVEAVSETIPIYERDRTVMALLPFHHVFPLVGTIVAPLAVGATVAFSSSLTPADMIATLQNNKVGLVIGVPRLYAAIHKGVMDKVNARLITRLIFKIAAVVNMGAFSRKIFAAVHRGFGGHIDYLVSGGAKLDENVARDFKTLGFEMLEGYGMTEAAPMISFTRPGHWKIGAAGEPMPTLDVAVKDGEIVARGRNIMQGYYEKPGETDEILKDGWLHTGDTGYIDDDGHIHITGRIKETIVLSNGKNINPEEIEKKLKSLSPCVADVGVYMKDDTLQAAICPDFRVLREKGIVNIDEMFRWDIIDRYNRQASPAKKIMKFILMKDELPKTRLGKLQRFKLALHAAEAGVMRRNDVPEPEYEEYRVIQSYLKEEKRRDIFPDDHIEIDLGLDSLDKVSLQTFLESTFGVRINEDIFIHHPTVEKLSVFMKETKKRLSVETVKWPEIFSENVDLTLPKTWVTQNVFKHISRFVFRCYFRLRGEGAENIPDGPVILAPNHQSFFDGLFVSVFLKNRVMKNTYFYAKEKHVRNRFLRALANRNNVIVMDINRDLKESLQKLAEVLRKGKNVLIFPEGTRTRTGEIGTFKKAFAILSSELKVPVVPVSITGAFEALPRGSFFPRPWRRIRVKFHLPVYPEGHDYETLAQMVRGRLATELT